MMEFFLTGEPTLFHYFLLGGLAALTFCLWLGIWIVHDCNKRHDTDNVSQTEKVVATSTSDEVEKDAEKRKKEEMELASHIITVG